MEREKKQEQVLDVDVDEYRDSVENEQRVHDYSDISIRGYDENDELD